MAVTSGGPVKTRLERASVDQPGIRLRGEKLRKDKDFRVDAILLPDEKAELQARGVLEKTLRQN